MSLVIPNWLQNFMLVSFPWSTLPSSRMTNHATPAYGYPGAVTETYLQRDLAELLEQRVTLLLAGYTTQEQLASLMHYMLQVGDTAAPETFIR